MSIIKIEIGAIYKNNKGLEFKVLKKYNNHMHKIQFIKTGYVDKVYNCAIKKGEVKDYLHPSIFNIACSGYAKKKDNEIIYSKWHGMIARCYDKSNKNYNIYGGSGVYVCDRWLRFDNFLLDIPQIQGYDKSKFDRGLLQLDKDIKQPNVVNKAYSLETCCFVDCKTNNQYREYSIQKDFIAISPDGNKYKDKSIRNFCKIYNLTATHVSRCLRGLSKRHKGWEFYYI